MSESKYEMGKSKKAFISYQEEMNVGKVIQIKAIDEPLSIGQLMREIHNLKDKEGNIVFNTSLIK